MSTAKTALAKAADGLLFPSETDAPFEFFTWQDEPNSAETVRANSSGAELTCQEMSLSEFLGDLVEEEPFRHLMTVIEKNLNGVKVYKCGNIHVAYFIVGRDSDGRLSGLKTIGVET